MKFAWKAFFGKAFHLLELELPKSLVRLDMKSLRKTLSRPALEEAPKSSVEIANSNPSIEEDNAATVIIRYLQRHIATKRRQSMMPGTAGNEKAVQDINKSLPAIQPHLGSLGLEVFRQATLISSHLLTYGFSGVFSIEPSLRESFPFYHDEEKRCFSTQYSGPFSPLAPNTWTLVMRYIHCTYY